MTKESSSVSHGPNEYVGMHPIQSGYIVAGDLHLNAHIRTRKVETCELWLQTVVAATKEETYVRTMAGV